MNSIKNILIFVAILLQALPLTSHAFSWPWSNASKFREECRAACIEDSFGKAKNPEIEFRCDNKCGKLPLSPKSEWEVYEICKERKVEVDKIFIDSKNKISLCTPYWDASCYQNPNGSELCKSRTECKEYSPTLLKRQLDWTSKGVECTKPSSTRP